MFLQLHLDSLNSEWKSIVDTAKNNLYCLIFPLYKITSRKKKILYTYTYYLHFESFACKMAPEARKNIIYTNVVSFPGKKL